ncbi:ATP-binding cassette subfamily B protein [Saccharothrix carnea]|uniref:ATP-binding cassette subfamily B protein n=1 Tax=Saccharothrix carnea TaxID=1280637 RepID=A0A2P8IGY7_SACCR|nr:ABC transporter ATP-binding protein [Saccharothrix carnea]PSL57722.1 ATP-binding cassette subfamily B protein [Saccharothrix carnea]
MTPPPRAVEPPAPLIPLLRQRLRPHSKTIGLIIGLQLAQALGILYLPTLNADVIDYGILADDTGYILGRGGLMLVVTVVQVVCASWVVLLGARVAMSLGSDLRSATFARVQSFSAREVARFGAPSLIVRTTNDVQQVQLLVFTTLTLLLTAPFMGLGGVALALMQDVALSGVLAVAVPVAVVVIGLLISRMTAPSRAVQDRLDAVNRVMREQITGIRVIRAFVRDSHEQRRFAAANTDLMAVALRVGRLQAYFGASALLMINVASIAVVALGGSRIVQGDMQPGSLVAFLNYLTLILMAVMIAMTVFMMAPRAKVSAGRITEVLNTEPAITEPARPTRLATPLGNLDLRDVSFAYPGAQEPVLRGVDLVARPGQTTAVVGSTGSGKTTLVNLVARLLDADRGSVSVDGVDVRELDRHTLSAAVGLVPQRAYLFSGTIASNLRYGDPEATDDELWHALEVAQAREFVMAMPAGLDTVVGQGGSTVSGGQRQRLAIARALVAKPRIYLFDDSFSALDNATDAALRGALDRHIGDATRVVVAQRVSTIRRADRIVVLDAGRVEAVGTHDELLATSPVYVEIVNSQLTSGDERDTRLAEPVKGEVR